MGEKEKNECSRNKTLSDCYSKRFNDYISRKCLWLNFSNDVSDISSACIQVRDVILSYSASIS